MTNFLEKLNSALPYVILGTPAGLILLFYAKSGLTFEQIIELLNTLVWPIIVLIALLFFRKVFTYLFLSMEEFNFFGVKGKLKDVQQIIRAKADELWKYEKTQQKIEEDRVTSEQEIRTLRSSNATLSEALDFAERLRTQNLALQTQVQALLVQISQLQRQSND